MCSPQPPAAVAKFAIAFVTSVSLFLSVRDGFAQGSLTPPGAPTPTMKSLDQVASTGIALNATNTPGDASNHFVINQSGSYFLTGNLDVTKTNGIRVNVANVTIDLNGYQIARASGSGGDGITLRPAADGCTVTNGSITGFGNAIDTITTTARGCVFRDISAANCTNIAIRAGEGAVLEACRVHDNSGAAGILTASGATLRNCSAIGNSATNAIQVGSGSTLTNCTASSNTGTNGIFAGDACSLTNCAAAANTLTGSGIVTGEVCPMTNCTAYNNTAVYGINAGIGSPLVNCSASSNTGVHYGIFIDDGGSLTNGATYSNAATNGTDSAGTGTGFGCFITASTSSDNNSSGAIDRAKGEGFFLGGSATIQSSTARSNTGSGIVLSGRNVVRNNSAIGNAATLNFPAGIYGNSSSANRVENNNVTDNQLDGFLIDMHALIINNTLSGEIYVIDTGNSFGAIVDDTGGGAGVNGNSASATFGSPNAWANFTY